MHLHILGICGTFMGGLALIARAAGHTVTGCDTGVYPPMSTQLEEQGIRLIEGFDASQVELKPDLYIVGNVVTRGNPLMEAILDRGLPYTSGPQWLGVEILQGQHVLAVAGTHGKTTTSSMLAWILEHAGMEPNFLIGGIASDLKVSARYQPSRTTFVIEADEYDTAFFDKRSKFVHYRPRTAVLNNLEFDHADIFPDLPAIETQFHHLVRTIPSEGRIIRPSVCEPLDRVLARGCWTPVETFGPGGQWQAVPDGHACDFQIKVNNAPVGTLHWDLTGEHNRMNALAALAAAEHLGVPPPQGIEALSAFKGVKRRMELRGTVNGIKVYDDFAHHPTAISTTLEGLRKQTGKQRILAVIEPRSNTMKLGSMAARLPAALQEADLVFCFGASSGKHALGWNPAQVLSPLGERASAYDDLDKLMDAVCLSAAPGDSILVMSNGSFAGIHQKLLDRLQP
ncbi:UDP-N-acetylmuramate:L-alanyl-gamma-D-glutamyl-meso-diaminopimelate ligase [Pollutimonas subterranea]|uniref:UDP-N-acetylmuramate--L-alanyl-gamma-D-glutamyl-meso-2,6-diaminoheptandioate ligase n=1 Tax=Pollutimonas subterranea TaxID=2045210 RepID=A0A2N4U600_9BURK|nr:UDP-N-acetylmuramate:L-alanyl-gamma-D-glutamyl-meso-diaminopimelate ligase [Pollutimonas subterranea]PLC50427.1 UDP-N-acetylmuramate:L-alanyl-gamma-D-glutamyl-meso-diaminopimelate ligase [Pollutimonas subterranea]